MTRWLTLGNAAVVMQNAKAGRPKLIRGRWNATERRRTDKAHGSGRYKVELMDKIERHPAWADLGPRAQSVFHTLWSYAGHPETDIQAGEVALRHCFPSIATIGGRQGGRSRQTIYRALAELRKAGLVEWIRTRRGNCYVLFPPPAVYEPIQEAIREDRAERTAERNTDPASADYMGSPDPSPDFSTRPEPAQTDAVTAPARTRAGGPDVPTVVHDRSQVCDMGCTKNGTCIEPLQGTSAKNQKEKPSSSTNETTTHPAHEGGPPAEVVEVVELLSAFGIWRTDAERLARLPHTTPDRIRAAIETAKFAPDIRNRPAVLMRWLEHPDRLEGNPEFGRRLGRIVRERQAERLRVKIEADPEERARLHRENRVTADRFRPRYASMTEAERADLVAHTLAKVQDEYGQDGVHGFVQWIGHDGLVAMGTGLLRALTCDLCDPSDKWGVSLLAACAREHENPAACRADRYTEPKRKAIGSNTGARASRVEAEPGKYAGRPGSEHRLPGSAWGRTWPALSNRPDARVKVSP